MKRTIELESEDIKKALAKHFNVKPSNVTVNLRKVYTGYGIGEHEDVEVIATVTEFVDP